MMDLYWWKKEPNFGDALNADLFSKLMGVESVRWVPAKKCDAIFIGSILEHFYLQQEPGFKDLWRRYFRRCVHVCGAGFLTPPPAQNRFITRRFKVHALRGVATLARMRKITGDDLSDVVLGDPGLLVSKLMPVRRSVRFSCGIIPHHLEVQEHMDAFLRLKKFFSDAVIIDPRNSTSDVMDLIGQCDVVLSSAMHGLIVADSMGIANLRLTLSKPSEVRDYKFNDYYSVYSRKRMRCFDLNGDIPSGLLESVKNGFEPCTDEIQKIQDSLIGKFKKLNRVAFAC